jgi:uncharacterized hydrophobic protein (TIGR00271 family)
MNAQAPLLSKIIPQVTETKRAAIRESVASGAALNGSYLAMNLAAAMIAGFGLLENSPAVIIGAMLIALLYGPIVGIALGLAEANLPLLRRALLAEVVGALLVLAAGLLIGISTRDLTIGSEILGRTSPSLVDLLIGLVGGLAGGFTFVSTGLSSVVVGVAIATALVPPLTTCGILLARNLPTIAAGAFLLFLANFTAIALGAMIVFLLAGHRPAAAEGSRTATSLRSFGPAPRLSLARNPAAHQRTVDNAKRYPKSARAGGREDSRSASGRCHPREARRYDDRVGRGTHAAAYFPRPGRAPQRCCQQRSGT